MSEFTSPVDEQAPDEGISSTAALLAVADREGLSEKPKSFGRLAWERFIHHKLAIIGALGLVIIVLAFFIGPMVTEYKVDTYDVMNRLSGPSASHWFGTDEIGRDLFVRTAQGGQYSLQIGFLAAAMATAFGTMMGALAGYFGKALDVLIGQLINLLLVVPALIVLSVFALRFGSTWWKLAIVLAALLWTRIARVVRGVVLSLKEQEFIMAARAAGASHARIIFRHILPNVVGVVAVEITLLLGTVIVLESTLSFLGLGVKPPETSLGLLVADAKGNIDNDPVRVLTPGIMIVLIVLCVNFLGDGLRDALDPRSRSERG
ncbi:MAG: ABC transporter permease [Ilumatobacter coccineus]|uniref:ABC transporter permease n=1 Tax=Ilumatobacter coccineus TaxID=467094 RepID=A0A2G6K9V6_9ACTN|nr:MAG: ABC transporter permease [Ilumatobacter coccineus]